MILIQADNQVVENYQMILKEDWTIETMNESMMLLGRCLSNTQNELAFEDCFSREDYINKSSRLNKGLEGYFTYYFTAFNETGFHSKNFQVPKRRNSIKLDLSLKSVEILYYLNPAIR